jgi:ATP-dependent Clp protease ATP-binding subunit ClpC
MVVADESHDAAAQFGHTLTTAHMLLCMFTVENQAASFLRSQGVTGERLLDAIARKPSEPPDAWDRILRRGREVASVSGTQTVSTMHVLVAMASFVDSAAHRLLSELPVDLARLRSLALAAVQQNIEEPADASLQMPGLRRAELPDPRDLVSIATQASSAPSPTPYHPPSPVAPDGARASSLTTRPQRSPKPQEPGASEPTAESVGPSTSSTEPPGRHGLAAELRPSPRRARTYPPAAPAEIARRARVRTETDRGRPASGPGDRCAISRAATRTGDDRFDDSEVADPGAVHDSRHPVPAARTTRSQPHPDGGRWRARSGDRTCP